ncbi:MAG: EF-P lysine aminoacylase GenX [Planctomycetes bacterium]|nr:EF-P lysine aminoacylase GenX [Planctomycetota bacterium]
MPDAAKRDDFGPTASWENLRLRAGLLGRVREFFGGRGFLEVETPILSADTVVDRHLDPFCVACDEESSGAGPARHLWLQTSPEFAMKRLLAAGGEAIYQVTRAFRQGERGRLHNPEFSIVEWYRTGDGMSEGIGLLSDLCETLLAGGPAERISYREAFERHANLDPHKADAKALKSAAKRLGIEAPPSLREDDRDGWLDLLLSEQVGPRLGLPQPAIVYDYPASQAALARVRPGDPPLAERFELFVSGIELANGYHELVDADELARRNAENNALRKADGKRALPEESRLLAAMAAGLPAASGAALGFDRVVMLAAGATRIEEVIAFPFDRA